MPLPYWKTKRLEEMTPEEWESLCDGCARCCLIKFQDEDTGHVYHTNVVCEYLEIFHCRCTRYDERSVLVPTCLTLTPQMIGMLSWMPETCAYRLLAEGMDLPPWHHLVCGDTGMRGHERGAHGGRLGARQGGFGQGCRGGRPAGLRDR